MIMFTNYLKTALRIIKNQKLFSVINITGLSVGLAVFIIIILLVRYENRYDQFHTNYKRIYRVVSGDPGEKDAYAGAPSPLGPMIVENLPEAIDMVRLDRTTGVMQYDEQAFFEKNIFYADPSFFTIFSFPLISGDVNTVLESPDAIVITQSIARKYFGDENPIGKVLHYNGSRDFIVTAVAADVPSQSHLHFDFVVRYDIFANMEHWGMWNWFTYVLGHEKANTRILKEKFSTWAQAQGYEELAKGLYFQPLKDIHFQYNRSNLEPAFNGDYLKVFMGVALVVLILACINFMNMATARSTKRAKEVGVKKCVGCSKNRLMVQFFSEAFIMTILGLLFSLAIVYLCLPVLNTFLEKNIVLPLTDPAFIIIYLILLISTTLFAGMYPALLLSSFNPSKVLKKEIISRNRPAVRNILVVFQFLISIALIFSTLTIYKQMNYIQTKNLSMNSNQVLNIRLNRLLYEKGPMLKNAFLQIPGVKKASLNSFQPTTYGWHQTVGWEGQKPSQSTAMWIMAVDKDFFSTLNIPVIEGEEKLKNFKESDDQYRYCLNRAALETIGWKTAMDKQFSHYGQEVNGRILGITENFHFRSLHHQVAPLVMIIRNQGSQISLRLSNVNMQQTITLLRKSWEKLVPEFEMDFYFLDQDFNALYGSETKLSQILIILTVLSLFIASLGLFSLAAFTAEQKTKEIGIRKVMGASILQIMRMLFREFTILVMLANLIAWPLAYFAMIRWLENFAYRIDIVWWMFLLSGVGALIIALISVSYQTVKAARANPVNSLRYE